MSARRPIFNHLVAPLVGGPVMHDDAKRMLNEYRDEVQAPLLAEADRLREELAEQRRYAGLLEAEVCRCQPVCEGGEYLHEADCPVVPIQMRSAGLAAEGGAS